MEKNKESTERQHKWSTDFCFFLLFQSNAMGKCWSFQQMILEQPNFPIGKKCILTLRLHHTIITSNRIVGLNINANIL